MNLIQRFGLLTVLVVGTAGIAEAKIVAAPDMAKYCVGEAAAKLGTKPGNILTLPVEKSHGKYVVYGQSPVSGANVKTFECSFGGDGLFNGIKITSGRGSGGGASGAPAGAMSACKNMVGVPATVETVSPLRKGFTEIILREKASGRRVACTATDSGSIEDWVELR